MECLELCLAFLLILMIYIAFIAPLQHALPLSEIALLQHCNHSRL